MFATTMVISLCVAVLSIVFGFVLNLNARKQPEGNKKTVDNVKIVIDEVKKSLGRQNTILFAMIALVFVIVLYLLNWATAIGFLVGAIVTILMHFVLAQIITQNCGRAAEASRKGLGSIANIALKIGVEAGLLSYGIALLVAAGFYAIFKDTQGLIGLAFGVCLVSLFTKLSGNVSKEFKINVSSSISFFELIVLSMVITMVLGQAMFQKSSNTILFPIILASASAVSFAVASLFTRFFKSTKKLSTIIFRTLTIEALLFAAATFFTYNWMIKSIGISSMINFYGLAIISLIVLFLGGTAILLNIYHQIVKSAALIAEKSELPDDAIDHLTSMGQFEKVSGSLLKFYSAEATALVSIVIFASYYRIILKADKSISFDLSNYLVLTGLFVGATAISLFYFQKNKFIESTNKTILLCSIIILLPVIIGLTLGPVALGGFVIGIILTGLFATVFHSQSFANIVRISSIVALLIASKIV